MKKGLIFATTLAMALGVGVAVGAHQNKAAEVKAASTTLYLDISGLDWWDNDGAEVRAHCWGGSAASTTWPGKMMSLVTGTTTKYSVEIDDGYTSVIFTRVNPSDHTTVWNRSSKDQGTPINLPSDYSVHNEWVLEYDGTNYDDGNYTGSWSLYTPPAATYTVTCVLDGVSQTPVQVAEGDLPAAPAAQFGKSFSGWCSDSDCTVPAVGVTADTTVYGKFTALPTVTYTVDVSRVSTIYSEPHLYAFEDEASNAAWPGVAYNGNTITIPNDAKFIITDGATEGTKQTVDITQSGVANDTLRILADVDGEGHNEVVWESAVDEPAEDGYYLISSLTDYKYAGATPMTQVDPSTGNVAVLLGYNPEPGEKIKARSYFSGEDKYSANVDGETDYGETDSDLNFEFANTIGEDDTFDIYAYYDEDYFLFSVAPHAERVTVTVVAKQFAGSYYQGETSALYKDTDVIKGQPFTVPDVTPEGYVALGVYSDFACTVPFESGVTPVESDMLLHIKAMQLGWYLAGGEDETFSVENSMKLSTSTGNKCTGAVEVPEGTTEENPFVVKPLEFVADAGLGTPGWAPATYVMGHEEEPAFVHIDEDTNFAFTVPGTYAFYVNDENKVWFNGGEYAYIEDFLSHTGTVCDDQGKDTDLELLQQLWAQFEEGFKGLSEDEIKDIKDVGFNGGDEKSDDAKLRMVARYAYIITKYGTGVFKDFIWEQNVEARQSSSITFSSIDVNNSTTIIVISIVAVSALAFTTLLVFKKRKQK